MPEITLSLYFFPNWEHFGCLPLDGYTESSFAGSRGRQPSTSAGNLLGFLFSFSFSDSDYVMRLSFPSQNSPVPWGLEKGSTALEEPASKSNKMVRLTLVSFSAAPRVKATLKLYVPTSRLKEYPEHWAQQSLTLAPVTWQIQNQVQPCTGYAMRGIWPWRYSNSSCAQLYHLQCHCGPEQVWAHGLRFPQISQSTLFQLSTSCGKTESTCSSIKTCQDHPLLLLLSELI